MIFDALNWGIDSIPRLSRLLQAGGTLQDPSRIIMVSSVAGVVVGDMGEHGSKSLRSGDLVNTVTKHLSSICLCRL